MSSDTESGTNSGDTVDSGATHSDIGKNGIGMNTPVTNQKNENDKTDFYAAKMFSSVILHLVFNEVMQNMTDSHAAKYDDPSIAQMIKNSVFLRFMNAFATDMVKDDTKIGKKVMMIVRKTNAGGEAKKSKTSLETFIPDEKERKKVVKWFNAQMSTIRPMIDGVLDSKDFVQNAKTNAERKRVRQEEKRRKDNKGGKTVENEVLSSDEPPPKKKRVTSITIGNSDDDVPSADVNRNITLSHMLPRIDVGYTAAKEMVENFPSERHPDAYVFLRFIKTLEGDEVKIRAFLSNLTMMYRS